MQIIQSIRDKGAAIVIVIIALSLIGFILMDAKQGSNHLFSSMSSKIGEVNGEAIELGEFNKRVKQSEDMQEQRSGQRPGGTQTLQLRDNMWNQIVAEKIFFAETEKLGIAFTSNELRDILLSNDPNNPFLKEPGLTDSATQKLDVSKAQAALANIKKFKGEQREMVEAQIIDPLKITQTVAKYTGMLNASVYYPSWMQQKETAEAKNFASISYVSLPYSDIADSTITVTDKDVEEYVSKHKDMFKQEEGRNISYVAFSQLANGEDSARIKKVVDDLAQPFAADSTPKAFLAKNTSSIEYSDEFVPKSKLNATVADTLSKLPVGAVYGPYVDKNSFVLAKKIAIKELPDSVHARHILIPLQDQSGKMIRTDSAAKALADSILNAVNAGADFAALALQYSSDKSNSAKGGDLGTFNYGVMVPEFNEFCFTKPAGSKGVVLTQFGYHVIDLLSQKDFKPAYKMAYMAKEISSSEATINKASLEATRAASQKTAAELAKYVSKNGLQLTQVPQLIKENDYQFNEFQDARQLVRWVFEAKKGDVSEPFNIGDKFVVAQVDKILKKGTQDAATARSGCEAIIRNRKKAELIIKKAGAVSSLEALATANNKQVQQAGLDSSLTMTSQIINGLGQESKVIGAAFNKDYQNKVSPPIAGTSAVYFIKVNSVQSKPADTADAMETQANSRKATLRSQVNNWFEGLKKPAEIEDKRSKYF
ncbi:MAG: peptidylprolyl isomerase [Bacteroidetes bacterium]|nr:peptidylprolyl isomerase [Bacteroidota bacterium]